MREYPYNKQRKHHGVFMNILHYQNNELYIEKVSLKALATKIGTPTYVYSRAVLERNWQAFSSAFHTPSYLICYAVKANSNLAILNLLAKHQSGFDIVSLGELERVLKAGGNPQKIVFSGVGKQRHEIIRALDVGIYCFNVESETELHRLQQIAEEQQKIAPIALRINPNIDAKTHPHIATGLYDNKFGIADQHIMRIIKEINQYSNLKLIGIACHIGSQLTELSPFIAAIDRIIQLLDSIKAAGIDLQHVNVGGGLGVRYQEENPPSIQEYVQTLANKLKSFPYKIILEPGRAMIAEAGILLTQVAYLKQTADKNFAIVNAGMNDLIRPALYDAWHPIFPVQIRPTTTQKIYDIVGPVCESADFLGKKRLLALEPDDLLAIGMAGAYGFSMSSNYNSRPRAAEILVDQDQIHVIRHRETLADLFANEYIIEDGH